jgi:hypothetical protein
MFVSCLDSQGQIRHLTQALNACLYTQHPFTSGTSVTETLSNQRDPLIVIKNKVWAELYNVGKEWIIIDITFQSISLEITVIF